MSIWEFTEYNDEDLDEILEHIEALMKFGIEPDEDMLRELTDEIEKREEENGNS